MSASLQFKVGASGDSDVLAEVAYWAAILSKKFGGTF